MGHKDGKPYTPDKNSWKVPIGLMVVVIYGFSFYPGGIFYFENDRFVANDVNKAVDETPTGIPAKSISFPECSADFQDYTPCTDPRNLNKLSEDECSHDEIVLKLCGFEETAQLDVETERDLEMGKLSRADEDNLSHFYHEIEAVKGDIEEISNPLTDLQNLNEETKTTQGTKILCGIRDRMDSDMVFVIRKAKIVKVKLELLERSNVANCRLLVAYAEGTVVDRTRVNMTNGLRVELKDIVNEFQALREKIISDYKGCLIRR